MTPTPQKLTPEMIEAVAHIVMHGNRKQTLDQARAGVVDHQDHAFLVLTAASKHTGADDLAEALNNLIPYFEGEHHPDHPHCREAHAALAKHRALMGRV